MWADMPSLLIAGDHRPHKVVQTRGGYARGESQLRGLAYSCCLEPQRNGYKLHAPSEYTSLKHVWEFRYFSWRVLFWNREMPDNHKKQETHDSVDAKPATRREYSDGDEHGSVSTQSHTGQRTHFHY